MPERDDISRFFLSPELKFISSKKYKKGHLWEVEKVRQSCEICPKCATPSNVRYGRVTTLVRETPAQDKPLWLKIHKHRYFCKACKKPFTEVVDGVMPRRRTTQRFRKQLMKACTNYTDLSRVRKEQSCSSGLIYQVCYEQAEVKLRERKGAMWPTRIGIDEHFFTRRNGYTEYVTVITNHNKRKLFEVAYGKDKKGLIEQLKHIPGRERVKVVTIDMSNGYKSLVKTLFPNAKIVADKFHVLRLPTPAIIKERRLIHGHRQDLRTRRLLLKNRKDLDYDVRCEIDSYLKHHSDLDELYRAKEKLYEFYRAKGYGRAEQSFKKLIKQLEASDLAQLQKLKRTLKRWQREILLYFELRVTNALTEAINSRAKLLQKRASGYKSFKNYRLRLLSACAF